MKITSFSVLEGGRVVVLHARKILYPLPFWNKGFCERSFEKNDSAGFVHKQMSGKRNPSDTTCVAKDSVANPDNVVTMQLYKTRICSFYDAGRCGLANCKFAHGACQLKNAPNLKKTKLCFDFLRGCCPKGDSCSFAHCNEDLRVTEGVYKTQLCHFFPKWILQER